MTLKEMVDVATDALVERHNDLTLFEDLAAEAHKDLARLDHGARRLGLCPVKLGVYEILDGMAERFE